LDIGKRSVGRESDGHFVSPIANVVAARGARHDRLAVPMSGTEANGDARHSSDRLDDTNELRRPECPAINLEAWGEIGDPHGATFTVDQFCDDDRRISYVVRPELDLAVEHHIGKSLLLVAGKEATENRI